MINAHPDTYEIVHGGFTHCQLDEAFSKVQDKANWKNPIAAWVAEDDLDVTRAAIEYFAGGGMEIDPEGWGGDDELMIFVTAPGYYAKIGA